MHTNENPLEDTNGDIYTHDKTAEHPYSMMFENTYDKTADDYCNHTQETRHTPHHAQRKKHARQKQLRILLSAAVFTLTLSVAAGWQILGKHSLSDFSAKAPTLPASEAATADNTQKNKPDTGTKKKAHTNTAEDTDPKDSATRNTETNDTDTLTQREKDLALSEQRTDITSGTEKRTTHITSVSEDWNLILVNPWNSLPENYNITTVPLENGQSIDARCYAELQEMIADCRAEGLQPLICSSYRTLEKQEALFQERIDELTAQGYSAQDARKKAATSVAIPGTSEHQLGLALDIVDKNQQMLDSAQENTMVQKWLMQNSWKYGFILRYPNNKSSLTGIIYEPWHYRYVGKKAAKEIYTRGICLEEYLEEQIS